MGQSSGSGGAEKMTLDDVIFHKIKPIQFKELPLILKLCYKLLLQNENRAGEPPSTAPGSSPLSLCSVPGTQTHVEHSRVSFALRCVWGLLLATCTRKGKRKVGSVYVQPCVLWD